MLWLLNEERCGMEELDVMHLGKLIRLYAEKVSVVQHNMITLA